MKDIKFRVATAEDATQIGVLVVKLTSEICELTNARHFDIDSQGTILRCGELLSAGHYSAIVGFDGETAVAVATLTETYALYAGGKVGVIQEFYVLPEYRSGGLGAILLEQVKAHGTQHHWTCLELCTPPLPAFDRTLSFYQDNGLVPVGGRKMRQSLM